MSMRNVREVVNSPVEQGIEEAIAYRIKTTPWGKGPTYVACTLWDVSQTEWADATADLIGGPAVNGDQIITAKVSGLNAGHRYRLEVKFTCEDGNTYECYLVINAVK